MLGGDSISEALYAWLISHLPEGKTILELGSGEGTRILSERWTVYSVEDQKAFLGLHPTVYIHAPMRGRWYDPDVLRRELPVRYDLLLVDGPWSPVKRPTRQNMLRHLDLFNLRVPVIVDDVHRSAEMELLRGIESHCKRRAEIFADAEKAFGVV